MECRIPDTGKIITLEDEPGLLQPILYRGRNIVERFFNRIKHRPRISTRYESTYRPEIDGLRALAVAAVIINHFNKALLPNGFLGVDIFFVISGYIITSSLADREHESLRDFILGFYVRRIKRLTPALILFVSFTCLIGFLFIPPVADEFIGSWGTGVAALFGFSNLYLFQQSMDYFGPSAELNLFTHTWSLGIEEQFYLIFPCILWFTGFSQKRFNGRRRLLSLMTLLIAVSLLAYVWLSRVNRPAAYFLMPSRFWELGLGCITFLVLQSSRLRLKAIQYASPVLTVALLIGILCIPQTDLYASTIGVVLLTSLLIATLNPNSIIYRTLSWRPIVFVGVISYSLYLWHWSILVISRWTIGVYWWTAPIQIGLTFMLAFLSYRYVEKPLRYANWSHSRPLTIGYGLGASIACAVFLVALGIPLKGLLYSGSEARLISKGVKTLMLNQIFNGEIAWSYDRCVLSSDDQVGKPIKPEYCTFRSNNNPRTRFLVIGNSFSAAEIDMYKILALRDIGSVTVTSTWGASPVPELANDTPWSKANTYYWNTVIPSLVGQLRSGDIVIMINDMAGFAPKKPEGKETADELDIIQKGLDAFVSSLEQKNVGVIFQTVNPFMRESGCTPDSAAHQWFRLNSKNACTYYTRGYSLARRYPVQKALRDLERRHHNFKVLDLFDVFCPADRCTFQAHRGTFMYRDEASHPSVEANIMSQPQLLRVVQALQRKMTAD
ncbi:MAG: acyltransferase family protein [Methyloceanibacter sp.]